MGQMGLMGQMGHMRRREINPFIGLIRPICPIRPICLIRPISLIRPICPICLLQAIAEERNRR